jgi:hypothetical protein
MRIGRVGVLSPLKGPYRRRYELRADLIRLGRQRQTQQDGD